MAREDAYQMLAYLVRLGCHRGLLLYPQVGDHPARRKWRVATPGLEMDVCTINLHTPLENPRALIYEMREILALTAQAR